MAISNQRPDDSGMGPASRAPDTEDGLYPDTDGDLDHRADGDSDPLPTSNEPKVPSAKDRGVGSAHGSQDSVEQEAGLDDGLRPTGGNA